MRIQLTRSDQMRRSRDTVQIGPAATSEPPKSSTDTGMVPVEQVQSPRAEPMEISRHEPSQLARAEPLELPQAGPVKLPQVEPVTSPQADQPTLPRAGVESPSPQARGSVSSQQSVKAETPVKSEPPGESTQRKKSSYREPKAEPMGGKYERHRGRSPDWERRSKYRHHSRPRDRSRSREDRDRRRDKRESEHGTDRPSQNKLNENSEGVGKRMREEMDKFLPVPIEPPFKKPKEAWESAKPCRFFHLSGPCRVPQCKFSHDPITPEQRR